MKPTRLLLILSIILLLTAALMTIPAAAGEDRDNDGLDDEWETDNGYDNTTKDDWQNDPVQEYKDDPIPTLIFATVCSFAFFAMVLGAFTTKYGKGRSRMTGAVLLAVGGLITAGVVVFSVLDVRKYPDDTIFGIMQWQIQPIVLPLISIIGAGIGAVLALVFFLVIIMKA